MAKMIKNGRKNGYTRTDKVYEPDERNPDNGATKRQEEREWRSEWLHEELSND